MSKMTDIRFRLQIAGGNMRMIKRDVFEYFKKEPDVMQVKDVVRLLHCSKNTVYKLIHEEGIVAKDRLKTKSSYHTLTLEPFVRGELLRHREKQEQMRKVMRSAYSKEYTDYVCVDALGKLYDPDFVTGHFGQLLKKHNLKKIRFHDLRHSCASVLLAQGVPMK